ncbi:hypothetical protein A8709_04995 [Paenibacillus pectinilyticus]|uniref:Uncharacterized protein n=1 Tax=Paenibacillus pectinilyticus TaxID=512399 RepID=A0A1C0ZSL2_9BACL|nr:hypothetical protein [Paenibacillus pectinilyticus]OCT11058.1 hypothetical protein A8709_04995 [Paenibacillus pectinilyticus]
MDNEGADRPKRYTRPLVLSQQPVRFETAPSWHEGQGHSDHAGARDGERHDSNPSYRESRKGNGHSKL